MRSENERKKKKKRLEVELLKRTLRTGVEQEASEEQGEKGEKRKEKKNESDGSGWVSVEEEKKKGETKKVVCQVLRRGN